ncbi:MAG: radical SAM protein [Candidatus Omnitrophota bacterium]
MLPLILKLPFYYLARKTNKISKLPFNLTLSVTYRCNSRCKTCNVYEKDCEELSLPQWKQIFKKFGKNLLWATISGGEPFLRTDLAEIVYALYDYCRPQIINIPTNGILTKTIVEQIKKITAYCQNSQIIVNVSIDDIGQKHDGIRGIDGNYDKTILTFNALKGLRLDNLSVGIHTVISKFNVKRIPDIYAELIKLAPDSYITEIAEEREELGTIDSGIGPGYNDFVNAIDFLLDKIKQDNFNRVGRLTRAFRIEYYKIVKQVLKEKKQIIPCYAGFASAQVSPEGNVWMCCIKAQVCGNLKAVDYDFKKIWDSELTRNLRKSIIAQECYCPLANASYTNMLFSIKTLFKILKNLIRLK